MLSLLRRVIDIRPGEAGSMLLSAAYFFCLLCSYFVLRPVREAMGLAGGVNELTWLFMGTLVATLAANVLFSALVTHYPRQIFVPVTNAFFIINLLAFAWFLYAQPERVGLNLGRVFYIWLSVFSLLGVSVFWGLMADLWHFEQSKRVYGLIGVGGTVGALAGAAITKVLVRQIGAPGLMLVAAALLTGTIVCVLALARRATRTPAMPRQKSEPSGDLWNGIRLVGRSRYLGGICAYMLLMAIASTFLYFAQARIVANSALTHEARTTIFAGIDFWTQVLTLGIQLLATARLVRWFGVGATMAAMPVFVAGGIVALWLAPLLATLVVVQVLHRASRYAVSSIARETLFTVVTREEKYKAKSLIDTFIQRSGDVVGALADKGIAALSLGLAGVTLVAAPLAAIWVALSFYLSRQQQQIATGRERDRATSVPDVAARPAGVFDAAD